MTSSINLHQKNGTPIISRDSELTTNRADTRERWPRALLALPALLFFLIAVKTLAHPAQEAAAVGILLQRPLGFTILRIGFGGFPLGCAIFVAACVISRKTLTGFLFVAILDATVLAVRTLGMLVDGTVRESMPLIIAEIVLLAIALLGIFASRSQKASKTQPERI